MGPRTVLSLRQDELAVFVGNLRTDTPDDELKESIVAVIDVTGIKVTTDQVVLIHKAYTVHAFIYLSSMDEKTWVRIREVPL